MGNIDTLRYMNMAAHSPSLVILQLVI